MLEVDWDSDTFVFLLLYRCEVYFYFLIVSINPPLRTVRLVVE